MPFSRHLTKAILTLLSMVWAHSAVLSQNVQFMQINLQDKQICIALADSPVINYTNNQLHIATTTQLYDINVAEVINYTFTATDTGIQNLMQIQKDISAGQVVINGLPANSVVELITVNGHHSEQLKASPTGQATLNLGQYPKGVYILRTANSSFKITNQ